MNPSHGGSPIPPTDTQLLDFLNGKRKSLIHGPEGWFVEGAKKSSKTAREAILDVYPGAGT